MTTLAPLFDTHCHLDYILRGSEHPDAGVAPQFKDVWQRAEAAGVRAIVNPGVTPSRFSEVFAASEMHPNIFAALSVHPTDVTDISVHPEWLSELETQLSHPKVVAIGETGLDYYWDTAEKELQQSCFEALLKLGVKHQLPVIVHDREAHEDVKKVIARVPGSQGIMHCFSGDGKFALEMIELGFFISFAGNITFKNAQPLRDAAKDVPLEWLLIETDSPFLSPMPFRGKPNEPERVRYVAETLAEVKGISYEKLARITTENALRVYHLENLAIC